MSAAHTPGPWLVRHLHGRDEFGVFWVDRTLTGRREFRVDNRCGEFKEADAHLISAAPDLLEALRMLADWADSNVADPALTVPLGYARAAISKATGEQA